MLNRCYMCKGEEKTSDHSLLHCLKARILWQPIFALFGVEWVMHSLVGKKKRKRLGGCSFMLFWTIWRERNRRALENCESFDHSFKSSFLYLFWD